jgi:integrase
MCTAMRRGDCCTLLRESVDLKNSFITVKTSKTGEYVQIPIFPLLREVLENALKAPSPRTEKFVFPKLEAHYGTNPDHLTDRVRRVMRAAGLRRPKKKRRTRAAKSTKSARAACAKPRCAISTHSASPGSRSHSVPACRLKSSRKSPGIARRAS